MTELWNEGRDWISDLRSEFTILFAYSQRFEEEGRERERRDPALFPCPAISLCSPPLLSRLLIDSSRAGSQRYDSSPHSLFCSSLDSLSTISSTLSTTSQNPLSQTVPGLSSSFSHAILTPLAFAHSLKSSKAPAALSRIGRMSSSRFGRDRG